MLRPIPRRFVLGAFSPFSLGTPAFWFNPADAATITPNGGDLQAIDDKSVFNRDASQGTAANQPAILSGGAGINGRTAIGYTGANNDQLTLANALGVARNVPGFTLAGIARIPTLGSAQRLSTIVTSSGSIRFMVQITAANLLNVQSRRLDGDSIDSKNSTATIAANTAFFFAAAVDYVNAANFLQIDAATRTQSTTWAGGGNTSDTDSNAAPSFGRFSASPLSGDLGELVGYPRLLSPAEIETMRTAYFKPLWGTP